MYIVAQLGKMAFGSLTPKSKLFPKLKIPTAQFRAGDYTSNFCNRKNCGLNTFCFRFFDEKGTKVMSDG